MTRPAPARQTPNEQQPPPGTPTKENPGRAANESECPTMHPHSARETGRHHTPAVLVLEVTVADVIRTAHRDRLAYAGNPTGHRAPEPASTGRPRMPLSLAAALDELRARTRRIQGTPA